MRAVIHRISSILRSSPWDDAQAQLRALTLRWDSYTVNAVLKTHPPMEKAWLFFRWAGAALPGFRHDRFTYTTMLDIFGEAGRLPSALLVLDEMDAAGASPDAATYTALMHRLAGAGDLDGAVRAWADMRRRGCRPTVVSYTAFVKVMLDHGRPDAAAAAYQEMLDEGLEPNCHTYTVLMAYLAGAGKFEAALDMMSKMQEAGIQPDKATCNILVHKCSKAGKTSVMTEVLLYMKEHSIVLRRPVFLEALDALKANGGSDHLLREVNPHLAFDDDIDFRPTATDSHYIIDWGIIVDLLNRKNWVALEQLIGGMACNEIDMDCYVLSEVMQTSCASQRPSCALAAFRYCLRMKKQIGTSAYSCLIGLYIRKDSFHMVLQIVEEMIKASYDLGTYLVSVLIYRLGCAGLSDYGARIFKSVPKNQNAVTYTALMNAYFEAGEVVKGIELYSEMKRRGIPVFAGTYDVLILGLENAGRIHESEMCRKEKQNRQWHDRSAEGILPEEILCNCLFSVDYG